MSGDCGHGWMYHKSRSEPCQKCYEAWEALKSERDELKALPERGPALEARLVKVTTQMKSLSENW